jgi:hypothetical protein
LRLYREGSCTLCTRVVPAFEEVEVAEQASGEELSSVGSGPEVGVLESESVVVLEQGMPWCI